MASTCQYCNLEFKYIRGHEKKCKAHYDKLVEAGTAEPSAQDVLAAKKAQRTVYLNKAREARSAKSRDVKLEKAKELVQAQEPAQPAPVPQPAEEPVPEQPVEPAEPEPVPEQPVDPAPKRMRVTDFYALY
jgi:outer membrane biosynthesis protein TonB